MTREQQKLRKLVEDHRAHEQVERELREAVGMTRDLSVDAAMRELAVAEFPALERRAAALREAVLWR